MRSVILRVQASWVPCYLWSDYLHFRWDFPPSPHGKSFLFWDNCLWGFRGPLCFRWSMLWIPRSDPWNRGLWNCRKPINLQQIAVFLPRGTCKYSDSNWMHDSTLVFCPALHSSVWWSWSGINHFCSLAQAPPAPPTPYLMSFCPLLSGGLILPLSSLLSWVFLRASNCCQIRAFCFL